MSTSDSASDSDSRIREHLTNSVEQFTSSLRLTQDGDTSELDSPIHSRSNFTKVDVRSESVILNWHRASDNGSTFLLSGPPHWDALPRTTAIMNLGNNSLSGSITLPHLSTLTRLDVSNNEFSGSVDFFSCAPNLKYANLSPQQVYWISPRLKPSKTTHHVKRFEQPTQWTSGLEGFAAKLGGTRRQQ